MQKNIPEWLQAYVAETCPYCGHPIRNNEALTDRSCSNPVCPEHTAHKLVALARYFHIKNYGIASARSDILIHKLTFHVQIIPIWFREPPLLQLHEICEIGQIKGCQKKWREYCRGYSSIAELSKNEAIPLAVRRRFPTLFMAEKVCAVKPALMGTHIYIMMSGSFEGYRSRSLFVSTMNERYGDIVQLVDVGKRRRDVSFLVKEAYATDHEKSALARAAGIPVVTPAQLEIKLRDYRTYIIEGGEGN